MRSQLYWLTDYALISNRLADSSRERTWASSMAGSRSSPAPPPCPPAVANAGITALGPGLSGSAFLDTVNVNFQGMVNVVTAAYPHLRAGASIIATGSVAAMFRGVTDIRQQGPGGAGYSLSKREIARFVHDLALALAPESIRVNAVHPGNVNTDMLHNPAMYKVFLPELDEVTLEDFEPASAAMFPLPISWLEPRDISAAVLFLASDEACYITGQQLRVDGGTALKHTPALPNP